MPRRWVEHIRPPGSGARDALATDEMLN